MKTYTKLFFIFFGLVFFLNCKETKRNTSKHSETKYNKLLLKYAKGFEVNDYGTYKTITITKPWPAAEKTFSYLLTEYKNTDITSNTTDFNAVIEGPIKRLVVTSTTHIPALELLGVEQFLVGFPGTDYVSSRKTRQLINSGNVRELGKNEGINTEVLLDINPDVVVGFGVDGINKTFETIKKAGVPVIYNGDWVESSALAKAEWIKFFGVLFGKEKKADSIFNAIETDYLNAKQIAKHAKIKPTVFSGAMHKEVWYLPNGASPEGQLLKDANVNYLWADTDGNGSLAFSFEVVFEKAQHADLWLNPSYYRSLDEIRRSSSLYTNFKAFKEQNIYSFVNTKGETGGVLYYELGTARPDLVLKDIIKIAHPNVLTDYTPHFFNKLE